MWNQIERLSLRPSEAAGAVTMAVSFAVLLPLSEDAPSATRFYLGWFGAWAGLVLSIWPLDPVGRRRPRASGGVIPRARILAWVGVALFFRLIALGFEPALSDDVYRYVWDGRVVLAGADPYATSPDDEELIGLRDLLWERTAHREVESVYPPLAQAAFAAAALFGHPLLALRLLWLLFDLATCWLVFGLARRWAGSERTGLLYAWNPLVVVEGVGMGHVDAFGAFWLALALHFGARALGGTERGRRDGKNPPARGATPKGTLLAARQRPSASWAAAAVGAALAAGVLVKMVPLVLIPVWGALLRSVRLVATAMVFLAVGTAPVWFGVGVPPGLLRYGVSWEFNGLLFEPLWRLLDGFSAPDRIKNILAWAQGSLGLDPGPIYPYVYPQFLAKVFLGGALVLTVACVVRVAWTAGAGLERSRRAAVLTVATLASATAASATLYPWYVIWLAVLLPVFPSAALALLCATMGFAYLPALLGVQAFPTAWALVWLPAVVLACVEVAGNALHRRAGGQQVSEMERE